MKNQRGKLTIYIGCMFAGKTSELIRIAERAELAKKLVLIISNSRDDRFGCDPCVYTHDGKKLAGTRTHELASVDVEPYHVICIDEGQFFKDITIADKWANDGKHVYVSGLISSFNRELFGSLVELLPKAEKIITLSAVCLVCGNDASFSELINKSDRDDLESPVSKDSIIVGASDKYRAVCRGCYGK